MNDEERARRERVKALREHGGDIKSLTSSGGGSVGGGGSDGGGGGGRRRRRSKQELSNQLKNAALGRATPVRGRRSNRERSGSHVSRGTATKKDTMTRSPTSPAIGRKAGTDVVDDVVVDEALRSRTPTHSRPSRSNTLEPCRLSDTSLPTPSPVGTPPIASRLGTSHDSDVFSLETASLTDCTMTDDLTSDTGDIDTNDDDEVDDDDDDDDDVYEDENARIKHSGVSRSFDAGAIDTSATKRLDQSDDSPRSARKLRRSKSLVGRQWSDKDHVIDGMGLNDLAALAEESMDDSERERQKSARALDLAGPSGGKHLRRRHEHLSSPRSGASSPPPSTRRLSVRIRSAFRRGGADAKALRKSKSKSKDKDKDRDSENSVGSDQGTAFPGIQTFTEADDNPLERALRHADSDSTEHTAESPSMLSSRRKPKKVRAKEKDKDKDKDQKDLSKERKRRSSTVDLLPLRSSFINMLFEPQFLIAQELLALDPAHTSHDFLPAYVDMLVFQEKILPFLTLLFRLEISKCDEVDTLLRGTSVATQVLDRYTVMVGGPFLQLMVSPIVDYVQNLAEPLEIDPSRTSPNVVGKNIDLVKSITKLFLSTLRMSILKCPVDLRRLMYNVFSEVAVKFPKMRHKILANLFFLRFMCPALVSPWKYGLVNSAEDISNATQRSLILVSKVLTNLSTGVGLNEKESYMSPLTNFIEESRPSVLKFFDVVVDETSIIQDLVNMERQRKAALRSGQQLSDEDAANVRRNVREIADVVKDNEKTVWAVVQAHPDLVKRIMFDSLTLLT